MLEINGAYTNATVYMAYKDPQNIIAAIGDTGRIEKQIRPICSFKSSDRFTSKKRR